MATPLADQRCEVCTPDTPTLSPAQAQELLRELAGWTVVEGDRPAITRKFRFKGFMPGVELVDAIARVAEEEGHHPDLLLTYGSLTVWLTTHAAGGLTRNDFVLAAKIDRIRPA